MADDFWSFILLAGMFGWIASTLVFIFKAFPSRGQFEARPALKWGCIVLVSFSVWIAGLLNA
jgi:hypothetical protein